MSVMDGVDNFKMYIYFVYTSLHDFTQPDLGKAKVKFPKLIY